MFAMTRCPRCGGLLVEADDDEQACINCGARVGGSVSTPPPRYGRLHWIGRKTPGYIFTLCEVLRRDDQITADLTELNCPNCRRALRLRVASKDI